MQYFPISNLGNLSKIKIKQFIFHNLFTFFFINCFYLYQIIIVFSQVIYKHTTQFCIIGIVQETFMTIEITITIFHLVVDNA